MIPAEVVSYRFHTCIATLTAFLQDPRAFLYKCFDSARHFFQLLQLTGSARWHPDILDRRCHIWIGRPNSCGHKGWQCSIDEQTLADDIRCTLETRVDQREPVTTAVRVWSAHITRRYITGQVIDTKSPNREKNEVVSVCVGATGVRW